MENVHAYEITYKEPEVRNRNAVFLNHLFTQNWNLTRLLLNIMLMEAAVTPT